MRPRLVPASITQLLYTACFKAGPSASQIISASWGKMRAGLVKFIEQIKRCRITALNGKNQCQRDKGFLSTTELRHHVILADFRKTNFDSNTTVKTDIRNGGIGFALLGRFFGGFFFRYIRIVIIVPPNNSLFLSVTSLLFSKLLNIFNLGL